MSQCSHLSASWISLPSLVAHLKTSSDVFTSCDSNNAAAPQHPIQYWAKNIANSFEKQDDGLEIRMLFRSCLQSCLQCNTFERRLRWAKVQTQTRKPSDLQQPQLRLDVSFVVSALGFNIVQPWHHWLGTRPKRSEIHSRHSEGLETFPFWAEVGIGIGIGIGIFNDNVVNSWS